MDRTRCLELLLADMAATQAIAAHLQQLLAADEASLWAGHEPSYGVPQQQQHDAIAMQLRDQNEQTLRGYYRLTEQA